MYVIATKASLNHQQKAKHANHATDQRLLQISAFKLYIKHYRAQKRYVFLTVLVYGTLHTVLLRNLPVEIKPIRRTDYEKEKTSGNKNTRSRRRGRHTLLPNCAF